MPAKNTKNLPKQSPVEKRKVIIELHSTPALATAMARNAGYRRKEQLDPATLLPGIDIDSSFPPTRVPAEHDTRTPDLITEHPDLPVPKPPRSVRPVFNYIIRAEVDDEELLRLRERPEVAGVFSDPEIVPLITCGYSSARGTHLDVARLLCVPKLKSYGLDGSDVLVAVVDTGINLDYLNSKGIGPNFDRARSFTSSQSLIPGQFPTDHGTMCAFDLCIAAPRCTILDVAVIRSDDNGLTGSLSDTILAYDHLYSIMTASLRLGELRSMVVTNSWGMPNTLRDLPIGDPGNYSDNINHPICRSVAALESVGADILFAAGNCGNDCPSGDCFGQVTRTIYGANSHPDVLCVAGVDITKARVGYSSQGPGRLTNTKPDICGYTHFAGSGVNKVDTGTSAACPVVAGVVAALRTRWQYDVNDPDTHPAAVRHYMTSTAGHGMSLAYDYNRGRGVVRGCTLVDRLFFADEPPVRLPPDFLEEFCKRYPELCPHKKIGSKASSQEATLDLSDLLRRVISEANQETGLSATELERILAAYLIGRNDRPLDALSAKPGGCGCDKKAIG